MIQLYYTCIYLSTYTCIYLMYIYSVFISVSWAVALMLILLQLFWFLYNIFSFVNLTFFNTYHNINAFLLYILSYYADNGTDYLDIHFKLIPEC